MTNIEYWNNEGVCKTFTHELDLSWLEGLDKRAAILDLGCGYGRVTGQLFNAGYENILGFDPSRPLIDRALKENPGPVYSNDVSTLHEKRFDFIICFALFTSCPSDEEQKELKSLIEACAQEKTRLYISDYAISDNPSYKQRYAQNELGIHGCFKSGSAIFRHHEDSHFDRLFSNWTKTKKRKMKSSTLNGNEIVISQSLYVKP